MTLPFPHFSFSHLNLYMQSPAKWALCYLHGFKDESPSMWRGQAVEEGIVHYLYTRDLDAAIKAGLAKFEERAQGEVSDEIEKELASIPGMIEQGSIALADKEIPFGKQVRVEHQFPGIEIPTIGFVDCEWPERGLEIKSTDRMPSEIREGHATQTAFYKFCRKKPFDILYVTKSKHQLIPFDQDPMPYVKRLEWAAHAISDLMTAFPNKDRATRLLPPPDYDHMYLWKSPAAREAAEKIWR